MTALAADARAQMIGDGIIIPQLPIEAGETIYQGALLTTDADGFVMPAQDTASHRVIGTAMAYVVNSGADGAASVDVRMGHVQRFVTAVIVQADVGLDGVIADDQTITDAAAGTNDIRAGKVVKFETGFCWVWVGVHALAAA